ncbi:conserved phage C-terminal domain-containing protein [Bacillus sp. FJAT-27445]
MGQTCSFIYWWNHRALIAARWKEGSRPADFKKVTDKKAEEWRSFFNL